MKKKIWCVCNKTMNENDIEEEEENHEEKANYWKKYVWNVMKKRKKRNDILMIVYDIKRKSIM